MSIEHYQNLLGMADRNRYTTHGIERHVRKFNPFLQAPHQEKVAAYESRRSQLIREARNMVETHHGKVVYGETFVNQHSDEKAKQGTVFTPACVKRVNPEKRWLVDTYQLHQNGLGYHAKNSVTANTLHTDVPEGYIQLLGPGVYRNLFVLEWSPIHMYHLQSLAEREDYERDEYKNRLSRADEKKGDADGVAYDVVGER